jgi:hypothetical protein
MVGRRQPPEKLRFLEVDAISVACLAPENVKGNDMNVLPCGKLGVKVAGAVSH